MILSFVLVLNLLVLYGFILAKKHLHLFEIVVYWMALSCLRQDYTAILSWNLGLISVSQELPLYWSIFFNRMILFPVLQVWYLSIYGGEKKWTWKIFYFVVFVLVSVGLEAVFERMGLVRFSHWNLWYSAIYWMASMIVGIWMMKGFRRIFYTEVRY